MTLAEFKAWLDGYTLAGGKDVGIVKAKLAEVWEYQTSPYLQPSPWIVPTITPWYPWVGPTTTGTTTVPDVEFSYTNA